MRIDQRLYLATGKRADFTVHNDARRYTQCTWHYVCGLFKDEKEEKVVFTEAEFIEKVADTHKIEWLVPNAQKNEMEPIRVTVEPHTTLEEDVPHEGEEFGYVISGRVWLHIGQAAYCVKKGEVFYFTSDKPHRLENRTNEKAVVLWVASPPTF